ncbi:MAG: T9SS type A sorting domain-containing protein [Chitinophagales bacterium]
MKKFITPVFAFMILVLCALRVSGQNGANTVLDYGPCDPFIPLLCGAGVLHPEYAADADLVTFATLKQELGLLSNAFLKLGFPNPAPQGSYVVFFVNQEAALNIQVLETVTMRLFDATGLEIATKDVFTLADIEIDQAGRALLKLKVPKGKTATSAELEIASLLTLLNKVNVFGAVHAPAPQPTFANNVNGAGPCSPPDDICRAGVEEPENAVDDDKSNFAELIIPIGIGDDVFLDLGFDDHGQTGIPISWTLGTEGLPIGLDLLQQIRLTAYDGEGNVVRSKKGYSLADIELLEGNKFKLKLKIPQIADEEIASAKITISSLLIVLTELLVYNVSYTPKTDYTDYFRQENILAMNDAINIYPNPASSEINIQLPENSDIFELSIFSADGKRMMQNLNIDFNDPTINISSLSNGFYIANIRSGDALITKYFVVEK